MLLEVHALKAGYGKMIIVHGVTLEVAKGEIVCIIGPNGAGKSTVLKTVAGSLRPRGGKVLFDGEEVTHTSIADKGRKGLIFIPQGDNIFPNLSVLENLEIAGAILGDPEKVRDSFEDVFERFPVMREKRQRPAKELSGGQRQMLALSRIIMVQPHLVLVDEPSLGLAPLMVDLIFQEILELNRRSISFLLVEQNARKGLSVSNRGYVLELGRNRLTGSGRDLLNDRNVQRLYLGG